MANHALPTTTSTYTNFVAELSGRFNDLSLWLDSAYTTPTNIPTNAKRWSSASNRFEKWNGTAWVELSSTYVFPAVQCTTINTSGTTSTPLVLARTGSTGVYQQFTDSSGLSVYVGASSGTLNIQTPSSGYSTKVAVSDTGLAVTGALSASGGATVSATSTDAVLKIDRTATFAGSGWLGSNTAYSHVFSNGALNNVGQLRITQDAPPNAAVVSSTGLAVTGTLSATGKFNCLSSSKWYAAEGGASRYFTSADDGIGQGIYANATAAGFLVSGSAIASATSTGLSVTGALSATGALTTAGLKEDTSGNLGLGVTPSAWGTGASQRAIQLPATAIYSFSDSRGEFLTNSYFNGTNYIYRVNYAALKYVQDVNLGAHFWHTAPSGTAGDAISFTQAMTLDPSGLAVTGALSASGGVTIPQTINNDPSITMAGSGAYNSRLNMNGSSVGGVINVQSGGNLFAQIAGSTVGAFSSSGLAVTGAITANSGATTDKLIRARRGSDDANQDAFFGWQGINVDRLNAPAANVQPFYFKFNGNSGTLTPLTVNPSSVSVTGALSASGDITSTTGNLYVGYAGNSRMISSGSGSASLLFGINGTEYMRLDTSGNLGLGVTPSAWSAGKAFEVGAVGNGVWCGPAYAALTLNTTFNSGYKYAADGAAGMYTIEGAHRWFTASSGTAGNPITFTQAMTLDPSGNLSIAGALTSGKILTGTSVNTTSGSAHGFTGIPSWVKRITFGFSGVSTAGVTNVGLQIGSGSYAASGYNGTLSQLNGAAGSSLNLSTAVYVDNAGNAVNVRHGAVVFTHLGGNLWAWNGAVSCATSSITCYTAGTIQLGDALDRIQIMLNSADTFDAGRVNITWE